MKRFLSLTIVLLATIISFAQTQQGIVKTRGRMVDGQLVEGKRLADATITLNFGNPLVSGSEGAFSFSVPAAKTYSLVSATKQGYTLADPEYTRRSFTYSAQNPFYVVLEDEAQRQADINAARRNIQNTMTAQLKLKEKELEDLKQQKAIDEQEYERRIAELYDAQDKSYELVKAMAERYASTDYDQLDEFNRKVQMYIEEGELLRADSMIQSKGSIEKRIEEYYQIVAANKEGRERLEQSESGAAQFYVDLSHDLYNKAEIAKQQFEWNEALTLLKKRADLDTTNTEAVHEYAVLCFQQKNYSDCEKYFKICRKEYSKIDNDLSVADVNCLLGYLYNEKKDYAQSLLCFTMALATYELLSEDTPDVYIERKALAHVGMAVNASNRNDYQESEKHRKLALKYNEQLFKKNPDSYRFNLMLSQYETGALYCKIGKYADGEKYYKLALQNCELLCEQSHDVCQLFLATIWMGLGILYSLSEEYAKSEQYLIYALDGYKQLAQQNPGAYFGTMAQIEATLGMLYTDREDYATGEKYYKQALKDYEIISSKNPEVYLGEMADIESSLGLNYGSIEDFVGAKKYLELAYKHYKQLFQQKPAVYRADLADACGYMGFLHLFCLNDFDSSEKYYLEALRLYEMLFKENPSAYQESLAITQMNLGRISENKYDYASSKKYYLSAIDNFTPLFKKKPEYYASYLSNALNQLSYMYAWEGKYNDAIKTINRTIALFPTNANFYDSKGEIFLMQGKTQEALEMWKKVLELNPNFLNDYPDGTELSNGLKALGLIE